MKYYISCKETGTIIDEFESFAKAKACLIEYERQDKKDNIFVEDFYEITSEKDEIVN